MTANKGVVKFLNDTAGGTVDVYEKDDKIYLSRFTREQREAYSFSEDFTVKTYATSGVILDFETDARQMNMFGRIEKGSSRDFYYFDIYVDGVLTVHTGDKFDMTEGTDFSWTVDFEYGRKHIEIYFPQLAAASVANVTFDGVSVNDSARPMYTKTVSDKIKAVFYGDSITQGYDALHPSFDYAAIVSRRLGLDAVNKGIGGDVHNAKVLFPDPCVPDVVFVAYGTNDWNGRSDRESFLSNIAEYHKRMRQIYPNTPVIAISPIWRKEHRTPKPAGDFLKIYDDIRDICANDKLTTVIDGLNLTARSCEIFSDGRLHPNDLGFFVYADSLCRAICKQNDSAICRELTEKMHF